MERIEIVRRHSTEFCELQFLIRAATEGRSYGRDSKIAWDAKQMRGILRLSGSPNDTLGA
jgi:hypothetical protein